MAHVRTASLNGAPTRRADALVAGYSLTGRARSMLAGFTDALRPRYRLRRDALWLALVPLGLGLYMAHLALAGGDPLAPFHAEAVWKRHFAGPYGGVWDGAKAAFAGLAPAAVFPARAQLLPGGGRQCLDRRRSQRAAVCLPAFGDTDACRGSAPTTACLWGVCAGGACTALAYPVAPQPLMSLPRFLLVLFPLNMWLAVTLVSRPRVLTRAVLVLSGLAMAFFVGEFSTWHWVA